MGTVIKLQQKINNSYNELKSIVDEKLILVEEKINLEISKLSITFESSLKLVKLTALDSFAFKRKLGSLEMHAR